MCSADSLSRIKEDAINLFTILKRVKTKNDFYGLWFFIKQNCTILCIKFHEVARIGSKNVEICQQKVIQHNPPPTIITIYIGLL